jgi:hypothetical protein
VLPPISEEAAAAPLTPPAQDSVEAVRSAEGEACSDVPTPDGFTCAQQQVGGGVAAVVVVMVAARRGGCTSRPLRQDVQHCPGSRARGAAATYHLPVWPRQAPVI